MGGGSLQLDEVGVGSSARWSRDSLVLWLGGSGLEEARKIPRCWTGIHPLLRARQHLCHEYSAVLQVWVLVLVGTSGSLYLPGLYPYLTVIPVRLWPLFVTLRSILQALLDKGVHILRCPLDIRRRVPEEGTAFTFSSRAGGVGWYLGVARGWCGTGRLGGAGVRAEGVRKDLAD